MARVVKKPTERKQELIDIAIKLFLQKGYDETSIKDIYSEANGSFGMFYHYFKSKEEIFKVVMNRYTDLFIEEI
ncbi:TetR/AcrR family transcriptional regulator [Clostridioides sp. ZZV15-6598]|uniref:TetR/AcrR family transcriptional regulator n=1 Tax=Clostridioides sp. ZZV15-6598 TaxID=2811501 RepID=UPI001D0FD4C2|nr:TetR/AcrR family transcriptional regulator [Clostridioides sp. ZZV15-6598]